VLVPAAAPPIELPTRPAGRIDRAIAAGRDPHARPQAGLGIHSGAIGDGIADLMEAGIVDNRHKEIDPAVTVATMLMGTSRLYRFADRNPPVKWPPQSSIRSSVARQRGPKRPSTQCLMSQFPTHPNREFFGAVQGIKLGDQGNFFPHQGIRSRPLFGICFDDKCDRPDRPRLCREGEEGAARCSKPPKPISRSKPVLSM
jgi:hypothetical protein